MNRKLQVFISSTFEDLRDERQAAVEGVLLAKHIPAGMELFTAGDASQLEVIKQWIRESDAYLLVLGARYGSIEPTSGLSYSEIEYDFAVANELPHFALVLNDASIERKHAAGLKRPSAEDAAKLSSFRSKVLSKSTKFVDSPDQIKIGVLQSLHEIESRPGLVGWLRSNEIRSDPEINAQMSALVEANTRLRESIEQSRQQLAESKSPLSASEDLAPLESTISLSLEAYHAGSRNYPSRWQHLEKAVEITWRDLFGMIAIKLLGPTNDDTLNHKIAGELQGSSQSDHRVCQRDWETVKAQFLSLDYVSITYGATVTNTGALFWSLTVLGKRVGLLLRSVRNTPLS
jgi:Domain of unknown function (DUF4062)